MKAVRGGKVNSFMSTVFKIQETMSFAFKQKIKSESFKKIHSIPDSFTKVGVVVRHLIVHEC